jgi:hypothetical protein
MAAMLPHGKPGKPPTGRKKMIRSSLVEADKGIFDRLLSSAATSMFDDDEDHSFKDDELLSNPILFDAADENHCQIPISVSRLSNNEQPIAVKNVPKCHKKVTFAVKLIHGSSCGYSSEDSRHDERDSVKLKYSIEHGTAKLDDTNYVDEPFSDFFADPENLVAPREDVLIPEAEIDLISLVNGRSSSSTLGVSSHSDIAVDNHRDDSNSVGVCRASTDSQRTFTSVSDTHSEPENISFDEEFLRYTAFLRQAHKRRASEMIQLLGVQMIKQSEDVKSDYQDSIGTEELEAQVMAKVLLIQLCRRKPLFSIGNAPITNIHSMSNTNIYHTPLCSTTRCWIEDFW